jgi:hypothetical protein
MLLAISGCASPSAKPITISTTPLDRPELVLPVADVIATKPVIWVVITPSNANKVLGSNKDGGMFALDERGYENLAINIANTRKLIIQQQAIIAALKTYYLKPAQVN